MAQLAIIVPRWVVYVARVQPGKPKELPKYGEWTREDRLTVLDILITTSIVGQSYAKIGLITGQPSTPQVDVEYASSVVWHGDRVALGVERGPGNIDWQFCGYCVQNNLSISDRAERRVFRIVGPEWIWGTGSAGEGAIKIISGQMRRSHKADDTWRKKQSTLTKYGEWINFDDEPAVFNPSGQKNMTRDEVIISPNGKKRVQGNIWETHDLRIAGVDAAKFWDMRSASKTIVETFGELEFAGIEPPDWNDVPMSILDKMRETSVEGMGVYAALREILGNKYAFRIDPVPTDSKGKQINIVGKAWKGFKLSFFKRTEGVPANFHLNPRGTSMEKATASIKRLETVRDISKVVNRVVVQGSYVRPVKLIYWGGATLTLTDPKKKTALQHGWKKTEGKLTDYKSNAKEITSVFADLAKDKRREWLDKYCTSGPKFQQNWRVFRKFTWNENADILPKDEAEYYKEAAATKFAPFAPDLKGIADTPEQADKWYRRRRPLLDTLYLRNKDLNAWEKHPPSVYMAIAKTSTNTTFADWKWKLISNSNYRLSPEEGSITFVAEDLADWRPFNKQDGDEENPNIVWPEDDRTFATLLLQGTLRICIECSVPCDFSLPAISEPTAQSGAPIRREVVISGKRSFIVSLTYDDTFAAPSGLTPTPIDTRDDALRQADITRQSAEDEQIHCSIITPGDWPRQPLGGLINNIKGRQIDLTSKSGRGAQIVAVRIDVQSFSYEWMTETLALAVTARDRRLIKKAQVFDARKATSIPNQ